jgi:hypothetical protein
MGATLLLFGLVFGIRLTQNSTLTKKVKAASA